MLRLFLFSQSALPYLLKTAEKRCFYTFTRIYNPLFDFIIGKIFSTFFEKTFYKMASLFPISEGVILSRAPSGTLKTESPFIRYIPKWRREPQRSVRYAETHLLEREIADSKVDSESGSHRNAWLLQAWR